MVRMTIYLLQPSNLGTCLQHVYILPYIGNSRYHVGRLCVYRLHTVDMKNIYCVYIMSLYLDTPLSPHGTKKYKCCPRTSLFPKWKH